MKRTLWLGSAALLAMTFGCAKSSDPKDVDVTKLKPALDLQVIPGDGELTLIWNAVNNEEDFSGYNIYFSTDEAATVVSDLGLTAANADEPDMYQPILFKDDKDEDVAGLREKISAHFNWPTEDATASAAPTDPKKQKFFLPRIRCNVKATTPDASGATEGMYPCAQLTTADKAHEENSANGKLYYTISGLTNGKKYSIFVTSSMDFTAKMAASKISSPTSSVFTVAPRKVGDLSAATFTCTNASPGCTGYNLSTIQATGLPTEVSGFYTASANGYCTMTTATTVTNGTTVDFIFETIDSGTKPAISGVYGTRIADLGPIQNDNATGDAYVTGSLLAHPARLNGKAIVPAVDALSADPVTNDIGEKAGYSQCGRSLYLANYHLYSIAFLDGTNTRYALLETGLYNSTTKTFDRLKLAVANSTDRRL